MGWALAETAIKVRAHKQQMHAIDQIKLVGLLVCFLAKQEIDSGLSVR